MCRIFFLMLFIFSIVSGSAQVQANKEVKKNLPNQVPSKNEMSAQMKEVVNELNKQIVDLEKQISDAKKNKEEESTIKELQDQVDMLKKQVEMIGGVNKSMSGISEKTFADASKEETVVPEKDLARINMLPKKNLTETELFSFIKNVNAQVEKMIPAAEKAAALKIYNETKSEYRSIIAIASAASGCWVNGHWEKALYLMGRVCMDTIADADHLNNYASFLIATGAEQAAIPILEYLNDQYPENSTVLNNIGQAWFGLGDIDRSKKYLDTAMLLYPTHSMANATMSKIWEANGDIEKSIAFLKTSLKENYDPEKEGELARLGYNITYDDMPEFKYPMKVDPIGLIPFIELIPEKFPSGIGDDATVDAVNGFVDGAKFLNQKIDDEIKKFGEQLRARNDKISFDSSYRHPFLETFNNPAWMLASRSFQLYNIEALASLTGQPIQLLFPVFRPIANKSKIVDPLTLIREFDSIWKYEVTIPLARLPYEMPRRSATNCRELDEWTNSYQSRVAAIQANGAKKIKQAYMRNAKRLDEYMKLHFYSIQDEKSVDSRVSQLISNSEKTIAARLMEDKAYRDFVDYGLKIVKQHEYMNSSCTPGTFRAILRDEAARTKMSEIIKHDLPCEFIKTLKTPLGSYSAECNGLKKDFKPEVKEKKTNVPKGQGQVGRQGRQRNNGGPMNQLPRGPFFIHNDLDSYESDQQKGPLNAEIKDLSQFSIEFDKWGNLVGLNFQLNKEGTGLADPDSIESGIDSRWSWNAIASPKKGFLNKIVIK